MPIYGTNRDAQYRARCAHQKALVARFMAKGCSEWKAREMAWRYIRRGR